MLKRQAIMVGKLYVNNARKVARVVLEADTRIVKFNTFHLDSGNSCDSSSECTIQDFAHWADREASPAEAASVQEQKMEAVFRAPQSPTLEVLEFGTEIDPSAVVL